MYLQLAENNDLQLADQCGLPPLKPLRSRSKAPEKWAEYDRKKAAWDACRLGKGKALINPIKVAVLAPGRALLLAMIDWNVDGLASRFATENPETLRNHWTKIGGDPSKLFQMINAGKKKPKKQINFLSKFTGPTPLAEGEETEENPYGLSNDQKAKIIGASTAAATTVAALIPPIAPIALPAGPILGSVIVAILPMVKDAANKTPSAEDAGAKMPDLPTLPNLPTSPNTPPFSPTNTPTVPTHPTTTPPPGTPIPWLRQTNFTGMDNKTSLVVIGNGIAVVTSAVLYKKKKKKAAAVVIGITAAADIAYYFYNKQNP